MKQTTLIRVRVRLTDEERRCVEQKMLAIETKMSDVQRSLGDIRAANASAWQQYGSELCAGAMLQDERDLENRVRDCEQDLGLLRRYLDGEISTASEGECEQLVSLLK